MVNLTDENYDPFISKDKIPRTPPSFLEETFISKAYSDRISTETCVEKELENSISVFQTDQNQSRFFIKFNDVSRPSATGRKRRKTKNLSISQLENSFVHDHVNVSVTEETTIKKNPQQCLLSFAEIAIPAIPMLSKRKILSTDQTSTPKRSRTNDEPFESTPVTIKQKARKETLNNASSTTLASSPCPPITVIKRPKRKRFLPLSSEHEQSLDDTYRRYDLRSRVSNISCVSSNSSTASDRSKKQTDTHLKSKRKQPRKQDTLAENLIFTSTENFDSSIGYTSTKSKDEHLLTLRRSKRNLTHINYTEK